MKKNKVTTQGYFLKRLRDSGFVAVKIFDQFQIHDPRKWMVMVDPENSALIVTCYENKHFKGDVYFELNDGGNKFPKNYNLKTNSMEIVVTILLEKGVQQKQEDCSYAKKD